MAFINHPVLPISRSTKASTCNATIRMHDEHDVSAVKVTRRAALAGALSLLAAALPAKMARAEREYANVGYLGGMDKVDVNNANVHAYMQFPGFYPNLAGLIAANGPYENVNELYKLPGLSSNQKKTLDKYINNLVALEPVPEYEIDKINNGAYK